ncbi:MAG TPA: GTPase HflX [Candidatus Eisenbacteria bacterium]
MRRPHEVPRPPLSERCVLVGRSERGRATRPVNGVPHARIEPPAAGALPVSLEELARLAVTAGARVRGTIVTRPGPPRPATFIGLGKLEELKQLAGDVRADVVVFDDDLSPAQVRNLEKAIGLKVVDRSELILDIFARRARTRESRLQVELAQLQYMLPRLTGLWRHLERQAGGIGTRGPGETQLETDRRIVRERIARLRRELQGVERERETQRARRRRAFRVALVGYTNAGKSTLFNALTRASVLVEDRLFATLDATTRQMVSPDRRLALVTDTVGFIRKLPHHLVASFHSTLVEAIEADLLVHVIDGADPQFRRQIRAVDEVLDGILEQPRPTLLAFNKSDLMDEESIAAIKVEFPGCVVVSAATGDGLDTLRAALWEQAAHGPLVRVS